MKEKTKCELEAVCVSCGLKFIEYVDAHQYNKYKERQPFSTVCKKCCPEPK